MAESIAQLRTADQIGVLAREIQVRLLNCSSSGCLLERHSRLTVGTIGSLTLTMEGHTFTDDVLVVRCQAIAGAGSRHHVGAKFLWTDAPGEHTLRRLMVRRAGGAKSIS